MDTSEFRKFGKEVVDYIADYIENIQKRRVVPSIEPGYLRDLLPGVAPQHAESFKDVINDFDKYIMPGVTHWQHPRFHAYFPAGNAFPNILADMLSDAIGAVGFSWAACPAMTELEMIMLDWLGRMIGLPEAFLPFTENGKGGGVIQGSASECNFVSLLAARFEVLKELRQRFPFVEEGLLLSKLVAYCSKEAHSSVEKACMIGMVKLKILDTDSKFRLRGETLRLAIEEDRDLGLIPFFVSTTLGTTSCCSFDVLSEIGPVCQKNDLWLHVDGAYGGSAMICPEFRPLMDGIEYAMSFNTNPNKFMLINFDCSTMWVKDRYKLTQALVVDPLYLQHSWTDKAMDYRHWSIPLSRRFRSLKLWFVIRVYGVEGLQNYIRKHCRLAKLFEQLIRADDIFEIVGDVILGLVCFRMIASEEMNQALLTKLNSSGRIHMVPASLNGRFVIRFCVCAEHATEKDIRIAYELISQTARHIHQNSLVPHPLVEEDELETAEEKEYIGQINQEDLDKSEILKRKNQATLSQKRSFLVRMVSDPKCYNPKIVRHLTKSGFRKMNEDVVRDLSLRQTISKTTQNQQNYK
ncbi:pyridoxal-dependent decarboxylase domain protein [Onchocerca flexuosa]|uniref:Pyridoxal-dependent decarboxylase domain protein n=1 Tax=Onchocerca flexuosa TaxID=387005 RepID=A0A238BKT5_9BILA|nr:pyridoxal-dependent decarboxylase domain protein [Onchocerca flexuosa]